MVVAGSHGRKYLRPLSLAVLMQDISIITSLLNAGANVDDVHVKCVVRALLIGLCTQLSQPSGLASDTLF
jgi:hypothetical protein